MYRVAEGSGRRSRAGRRLDFVIGLTVAAVAALAAFQIYASLPRGLISQGLDVWFQADLTRVFTNMTDATRETHQRTNVHPLHSLLAFPTTGLVRNLGFDSITAVGIVTSTISAGWFAAMYSLLRATNCTRADTLLLLVMSACTASSLFWFGVPETYSLGSLSIVGAFLVAAREDTGRPVPTTALCAVSALTLGVTVTNWMSGVACAFATRRWRRATFATVAALAAVCALSIVQK